MAARPAVGIPSGDVSTFRRASSPLLRAALAVAFLVVGLCPPARFAFGAVQPAPHDHCAPQAGAAAERPLVPVSLPACEHHCAQLRLAVAAPEPRPPSLIELRTGTPLPPREFGARPGFARRAGGGLDRAPPEPPRARSTVLRL